MKQKKCGFTLMELLVVITIIAVMMAGAIISYSSITTRSRDSKRKSDIEQIRQALEMYRADNLVYPVCAGTGALDVTCLSSVAGFSSYLTTIPSDPKSSSGFAYYYQNPTTTTYCLTMFSEVETQPGSGCASVTAPSTNSYIYQVKNP